jgi:hypothetical protein
LLGALLGAGLGAGGMLWFGPTPSPGWVGAEPVEGGSVDLAPRPVEDVRAVPATAELAEEWKALAPAGGVVRRNKCEVGEPVKSGTAPFVLDGRPILLLRTSTPVYRDLWPGARGADVTALQKELKRLKIGEAPVDGYFGSSTGLALRELWGKVGGDDKQNWMPLDQVVWMPKRSIRPAQCPLRIGQRVQGGDTLFSTGGGLVSLTVRLPEGVVEGTRLAAASEDVATELPAEGVLTDPEFLKAYTHRRDFRAFLEDPSEQLNVDTRLATPVEVVPVPPSAIYAVSDGAGCVLAQGQPRRVEILASELGKSLVAAAPLPTSVQVKPGEDAPPCG